MTDESIRTCCGSCGEFKDCTFEIDPYVAELGDAEEVAALEPAWWCEDCFDERRDDV